MVLYKQDIGYALLWKMRDSCWMAQFERDGLYHGPFEAVNIDDWFDDGWTQVQNPQYLAVHPCAQCDTPMIGDDYLCRACRGATLA